MLLFTVYTSDTGSISSPNYPLHYPNGYHKEWRIAVSAGMRVMIRFQAFELESSNNCSYDSLKVILMTILYLGNGG